MCTVLKALSHTHIHTQVTALASAGEADKAEAVVQWMLGIGLKPNVSVRLNA